MWYDRYQGPGQSADQYQQGQQVLFEFDTIFVRASDAFQRRKAFGFDSFSLLKRFSGLKERLEVGT